MALHPHAFLPGASKRLEALSDGVFAIACTLLVLEIPIPNFEKGIPMSQQWDEMHHVFTEMAAFVFSFLNICVFWTNHDAISKVIVRFDIRTTYLNIVFLLFISLIPFTTGFISKNFDSFIAVATYGVVLSLCSFVAVLMYRHLAFKANLFYPEVTMKSRKRVWKQVVTGPFLFLIAIALGWIHLYIPLIIYALTPISSMFLPQLDFDTKEEEIKKGK